MHARASRRRSRLTRSDDLIVNESWINRIECRRLDSVSPVGWIDEVDDDRGLPTAGVIEATDLFELLDETAATRDLRYEAIVFLRIDQCDPSVLTGDERRTGGGL